MYGAMIGSFVHLLLLLLLLLHFIDLYHNYGLFFFTNALARPVKDSNLCAKFHCSCTWFVRSD